MTFFKTVKPSSLRAAVMAKVNPLIDKGEADLRAFNINEDEKYFAGIDALGKIRDNSKATALESTVNSIVG